MTDKPAITAGAISHTRGATAWNASGFWVSPEGRLYEDDVRVIQSAVTKSDANEASLRALAQDILSDTDQGVRLPRRR